MQASTPNQPAHPVGHGDLLDDLPGQPVIHSLSDEILCDVLYHLSIQDKQRAQIVCKRWHVILKHPPRGLWGTVTWDIAQLTPPGSEVEPNFNYDDDDEEPDYELARDDDRVLCGLQWLGHRVKGIERLRINVSGIHRGFRLADRYLPLLLGVLATDGGFPKLELWIARGDSADNILESDIFCVPMFTDLVVPNLEELNIDFGQLWLMQRSQLDWVSWLTSLRKLDLRADGHRRSDPGDLPAAFSNLTLLSEALTGLTHVWLKQVGEWEAQSAFHIGRAVMQLHRDFASGRRAILPYIQYLP
ncbi:hypothetical protein WJX72_004704 [[Myrmecia] bisecta]|uniref:F-box domain-containing protein n=1 Tax=[Myrmecia] bisecta TaxID=41462 RepID=A0AAW1R6U2_9CHLO